MVAVLHRLHLTWCGVSVVLLVLEVQRRSHRRLQPGYAPVLSHESRERSEEEGIERAVGQHASCPARLLVLRRVAIYVEIAVDVIDWLWKLGRDRRIVYEL